MDYNYFERQMPGIANIRLFHAVPGAPSVDVYANDRIVARRLSYGQFTDYTSLDAQTYNIQVYPAGRRDTPLLSINLPINEQTIYTLAIIGTLPQIGIIPIEDEYVDTSLVRTNIRFANLSPNAPSLDLVLRDGPTVFSDIEYTEVSDYAPFAPGNYNFFVRPYNRPINVLYLPTRLLPRRNLTFYLIGLYNQQPSNLQILIPMDGSTYLRF